MSKNIFNEYFFKKINFSKNIFRYLAHKEKGRRLLVNTAANSGKFRLHLNKFVN